MFSHVFTLQLGSHFIELARGWDRFNPLTKNNLQQQCKLSPILQKNYRLGNTAYSPGKASTWVDVICCRHYFNGVRPALMGISDLSTYMADENAHIWFISDLFIHMNEAWNIESICFFPAYILVGHIWSVPHGRKKIGVGSLEPQNLNAAKIRWTSAWPDRQNIQICLNHLKRLLFQQSQLL